MYSKQAVIDAVADFYNLLSTLPYVSPEDVIHPPEGGWPAIAMETIGRFGKTEEVFNLLMHLPYVKQDNPLQPYYLSPDTCPVDYQGPYFQADLLSSRPTRNTIIPTGAEHFPA